VDRDDHGVRAAAPREIQVSALAAVVGAVAKRPPWREQVEQQPDAPAFAASG